MARRVVLTLDGSTEVCGATLLRLNTVPATADRGCPDRSRGGRAEWDVLARRVQGGAQGQAKVLLRWVDDMLAEIGGAPSDLGAIVAGTGPGTFTGVRIAVATARALSLALGIPVLGISTLAALAAGAARRSTTCAGPHATVSVHAPPDIIVPVVDARRGQVFYGLYAARREPGDPAAAGRPGLHGGTGRRYVRSDLYGVCDKGALGVVLERAGGRAAQVLVVAAEGAMVGDLPAQAAFSAAQVEPEALVVGQELLEEPGDDPRGSRLAPWLLRALGEMADTGTGVFAAIPARVGEAGSPEAVKPIYIRSPDADMHILKMRDPFAPTVEQPGAAG